MAARGHLVEWVGRTRLLKRVDRVRLSESGGTPIFFLESGNFKDRTTQTALDPLAGSRFVPGPLMLPWDTNKASGLGSHGVRVHVCDRVCPR